MRQTEKRHFKKTACPLDCPDTCGILAEIYDGKIIALHGDTENPYTNGFICRKMRHYPERLYSQERILYPMLRTGKKGQGVFKRISWDLALTIFAEKLLETRNRFGGEAILPFQYAGNMGVINRNAGYGLYNKLGTSVLNETICSAAASEAWRLHLSLRPGAPPENAADASTIIIWGMNCTVSNIHFWQYVVKARKKGAQVIVVDPYRNDTAKSADLYLQITPGGDAALALGAIKALSELHLLDEKMLNESTTGFAHLQHSISTQPWDRICAESGLAHETICSFAQSIAASPRTFLRIGFGLSRNSQAGNTIRAIVSLAAATGIIHSGFGRGVLMSSRAFIGDLQQVRFPQLRKQPARVINMAHLGHALTDCADPVRLLTVYNSNPAVVAPDSTMVCRGLSREDLFTVVHEQVMTPTARYADLILPATTFLENKDIYMGYGHFFMCLADRVIEPMGEAMSNFDMFQALAKKIGFSDPPFLQTLDERIQNYLHTLQGLPEDALDTIQPGIWYHSTRSSNSGITPAEPDVFRFPFALPAQSPLSATAQLNSQTGEFTNQQLQNEFPFMLITPPCSRLLNSTFGEKYTDREGEVLIHPADAARYCVPDGAMVTLFNDRGATVRKAKITDDTAPGLLVAEGLFWKNKTEEYSINALTSQQATDIGEGPTFHESRVGLSLLL